MRRKLVAGNWKMNGSLALTQSLLSEVAAESIDLINHIDIAVFPPSLYLGSAVERLSTTGVHVGGQNIAEHSGGAFTGEISAEMLADCQAKAVLIGHSERRSLCGEDDDLVFAKVKQALASGLVSYVCVGETLQERQADRAEVVVGQQLKALIDQLAKSDWQHIVIAYEPVWAIGTGVTASPEQAQQMHAFIRQQLSAVSAEVAASTQLLYGGSVKPENATELFAQPDIDGGLIGGASLKAQDFIAICRAAADASVHN